MHSNVSHIVRPSEDVENPFYGPSRRLHIMMMQIFADQPGGLAGLEKRIWAFQDSQSMNRIVWDEHLSALLRHGLSEPHSQRTVIQQMLYAMEWVS